MSEAVVCACDEFYICLPCKQALTQESGLTLDGQPATVGGYRNRYATVQSRGNRVEFSWPTVKRIINTHRRFQS